MSKRKNVLFITGDQWRGECLSAARHPVVRTPNLDRLATEGTMFHRHYTQATPCGPSRASLYTGLYLHNHRMVINNTAMDARHTNVALEARKAGYEPALFGYTDIGSDPRVDTPPAPEDRYYMVLPGMDTIGVLNEDFKPWLDHLESKGYMRPEPPLSVFQHSEDGPDDPDRGFTYPPAKYKAEDSSVAFLTNETINFIKDKGETPWFVHLSYFSPHPPFIAPEPYNAQYDPADVSLPIRRDNVEDEAAQHPLTKEAIYNQRDIPLRLGVDKKTHPQLSELDLRQARATYYGMMSEVDDQIGRLVDYLEESGNLEDTLIIFCSDHGEQLGDHWMFSKTSYFEQTFHTPLIIRDPDAPKQAKGNVVTDRFTENVDIMPTILDWLGLEVPRECDGKSLTPFLSGGTPAKWRTEVHSEHDFRDYMGIDGKPAFGLEPDECAMNIIRDERYKYVHFTAMPPLFFDLEKDPNEFNNLAEEPEFQPLIAKYLQKQMSWRMRHDDRGLTHIRY